MSETEDFDGSIPLVPLDDDTADEPAPPAAAYKPEAPLPRLWKVEPEPETEEFDTARGVKKKKTEKTGSDEESSSASRPSRKNKKESSAKRGRPAEPDKNGALQGRST